MFRAGGRRSGDFGIRGGELSGLLTLRSRVPSNTLDEVDRTTLEAVAGRRVTAETLTAELDVPRAMLEERLAKLVDNGLVSIADGSRYGLTENGRRVLAATATGSAGGRLDTPAHVAGTIDEWELRPDEAAAVRAAVSFLRYWGDATAAELVDAVYSETPAGYESAERWWEDCVEKRLASLPDVHPPQDDSIPEYWRYDGDAVVDAPGDENGRSVGDPDAASPVGNVRHGLERLDLDGPQLTAARVAFAVLFEHRSATTERLLEELSNDRSGANATDVSAAWLSELCSTLPGIERVENTDGETVWTYSPSTGDER